MGRDSGGVDKIAADELELLEMYRQVGLEKQEAILEALRLINER